MIALRWRMCVMADISIRGLAEDVKGKLRQRAASHGRSMEAEARAILAEAVSDPQERPDLFDVLMARFDELGGVTLDISERAPMTPRVDFT